MEIPSSLEQQLTDICIIGHITIDELWHNGSSLTIAGGVPVYAGIAADALDLQVAILTKLPKMDEDALCKAILSKNISFENLGSATTSKFENHYNSRSGIIRKQIISSIAEPFSASEVQELQADYYYVGPLTQRDMPFELFECLSNKGRIVLDAQGFLRQIRNRRVHLADWPHKNKYLSLVSTLKVNIDEARVLTKKCNLIDAAKSLADFGPQQIVVTASDHGSVVWDDGVLAQIPSFRPRKYVDTTGCGDTYMAAFLYMQLKGEDAETSGLFAAAAAAVKIEKHGPLQADPQSIEAFMNTAHVN